jgi:hypothetical protein
MSVQFRIKLRQRTPSYSQDTATWPPILQSLSTVHGVGSGSFSLWRWWMLSGLLRWRPYTTDITAHSKVQFLLMFPLLSSKSAKRLLDDCTFFGPRKVYIRSKFQKYTVALAENRCTCRNFREYYGPCSHAITACRYEATDPYNHFSNTYKVKYYRRICEVAMPPMSINSLPSDPNTLPSLIVKKRGRLRGNGSGKELLNGSSVLNNPIDPIVIGGL